MFKQSLAQAAKREREGLVLYLPFPKGNLPDSEGVRRIIRESEKVILSSA